MGEGGGDDNEEGESENEDKDGEGTRLSDNGLETKRRKEHRILLQNWCSGQDNFTTR